jgi:hypothetical protein
VRYFTQRWSISNPEVTCFSTLILRNFGQEFAMAAQQNPPHGLSQIPGQVHAVPFTQLPMLAAPPAVSQPLIGQMQAAQWHFQQIQVHIRRYNQTQARIQNQALQQAGYIAPILPQAVYGNNAYAAVSLMQQPGYAAGNILASALHTNILNVPPAANIPPAQQDSLSEVPHTQVNLSFRRTHFLPLVTRIQKAISD